MEKEIRKTRFIYIPGQTIGNITFIGELPDSFDPSGRARRNGLFKCHCGKEFEKRISSIKNGHTKGCGCDHIIHGLSKTPTYHLWKRIKKRCLCKTNKKYKDYGGRGITIYELWINNPTMFIDYVSSLNGYMEKGLTLDRINNDGNYEPGNLRWATHIQQANNKRNSSRLL